LIEGSVPRLWNPTEDDHRDDGEQSAHKSDCGDGLSLIVDDAAEPAGDQQTNTSGKPEDRLKGGAPLDGAEFSGKCQITHSIHEKAKTDQEKRS
jgi:hypothetical protein